MEGETAACGVPTPTRFDDLTLAPLVGRYDEIARVGANDTVRPLGTPRTAYSATLLAPAMKPWTTAQKRGTIHAWW